MAKILPRVECVESIDNVLLYVSTRRSDAEKLDVIGSFMQQIGVASFGTTLDLLNASLRDGECRGKIEALFDSPRVLREGKLRVDTSFVRASTVSQLVSRMVGRIKTYRDDLNDAVERLRFDLRLNPVKEDYFRGEVVSIKGVPCLCVFMSGPILRDDLGNVAVVAGQGYQTVHEILFHEFSHYFRVALEGRVIGGVDTLRRQLYGIGFSRSYLACMDKTWTNAEEINAIVGVCVDARGVLSYDYLNESEFNLQVGGKIRVAHNASYRTRVSYVLLRVIEAGRGVAVGAPSLDREELFYDPAADVI
jgi:hypothetical protein